MWRYTGDHHTTEPANPLTLTLGQRRVPKRTRPDANTPSAITARFTS